MALCINDLCDDLLCQIFDRLSVKKVMVIQRVNKAFCRSAKTWFKTVDEMSIYKRHILLSKSTGKRVDWEKDKFKTGNIIMTFNHADRLLNTFTGIKNVSISASSATDGSQLVHLISRCPNIKQFSLKLFNLHFDDNDWTRLVELIKHCDIRLAVYRCCTSPNLAKHLEQLFSVAKKVKSFEFNAMGLESFMTIALLSESAKISVDFCSSGSHLTDEQTHQLADIVSKRIETLKVESQYFKDLAARRFLKLSQLQVKVYPRHSDRPLIPADGGYEFPHLKRLTFSDCKSYIISCFFTAVRQRMEQLEHLRLRSTNFLMDHQALAMMLEKTPNIVGLEISIDSDYNIQFDPATISVLVRMFEMMSTAWQQLRNVEFNVSVNNLNVDHFDRLCDALEGFADRRTNVEVRVDIYGYRNKDVFEELFSGKYWPTNVRLK